MLKMQSLSKVYRTEMVETYALRNFNLEVKAGEFVAVTGPSGSGKTTFLTIAGLLESFTGGTYELDGQDVSGMNDDQRSRLRNQKIGFIFQAFNLIPQLTIEANVEVPLFYQGIPPRERRKAALAALEVVALADRVGHRPRELSGGQQQRVAIARALVTKPAILMADEPTGNLDSKTGQAILKTFEELHEIGMTIIMVTHDDSIAKRCKRVVRLADGLVCEDRLVSPQPA